MADIIFVELQTSQNDKNEVLRKAICLKPPGWSMSKCKGTPPRQGDRGLLHSSLIPRDGFSERPVRPWKFQECLQPRIWEYHYSMLQYPKLQAGSVVFLSPSGAWDTEALLTLAPRSQAADTTIFKGVCLQPKDPRSVPEKGQAPGQMQTVFDSSEKRRELEREQSTLGCWSVCNT